MHFFSAKEKLLLQTIMSERQCHPSNLLHHVYTRLDLYLGKIVLTTVLGDNFDKGVKMRAIYNRTKKIFFGKKECQSFISILQELFFPEFKSENQKGRIYYKKKIIILTCQGTMPYNELYFKSQSQLIINQHIEKSLAIL